MYCIFSAAMFGDPHIKTLDGFDYTYNGLGEFIMIQMKSNNMTVFELDGRTSTVMDDNDVVTNATIFSAFVGKDFTTGAYFQVEMAASKQGRT